jgi:hypothetical protein
MTNEWDRQYALHIDVVHVFAFDWIHQTCGTRQGCDRIQLVLRDLAVLAELHHSLTHCLRPKVTKTSTIHGDSITHTRDATFARHDLSASCLEQEIKCSFNVSLHGSPFLCCVCTVRDQSINSKHITPPSHQMLTDLIYKS